MIFLRLSILPLLLATACSSTRVIDNGYSVEDEKRMLLSILPQVRKDFPPLRDHEIQSYVSAVGLHIVRANKLDGNPYRFSFVVVDSPLADAFALPAGHILVSRALLLRLRDQTELAMVLAHEIGHVIHRHASARLYAMRTRGASDSFAYAAAGALAGGTIAYGLGHMICPIASSECTAQAVAFGIGNGATTGLGVQKDFVSENTLNNEAEADSFGASAIEKAGYSGDRAKDFYARLRSKTKVEDTPSTLASSEFLAMRTKLLSLNRGGQLTLEPSGVLQASPIAVDPIRKK